jgi:DNA repair protein RecO (recombination protein O)
MGEFHKSLTLLTSDLGLIYAVAFGAYKMQSRLRMGSEPFTSSKVGLYFNPVKKTYKITDLDVGESFERLRADLGRLSAASLWAEVVSKSFGAGETTDTLFGLFLGCLRLLDSSEPGQEPFVTAQFLWRFLSLCGYQPDTSICEKCGARFPRDSTCFYEPSSNAFLCGGCRFSSSILLTAGALRYLEATSALPLETAFAVGLDSDSRFTLQEFLLHAVRAVIEGDLKSSRFLREARAARFSREVAG